MDFLSEQQRNLRKGAMKKKEQAAGFNYSDAAWLSDRTVREAVLPWCFLLDTMHMYWSNGIVSWEVNAIYRLWQEEKVGNLVDFMSLDWKTSSGQSNTLSWRKKNSNEANFTAAAYRGDSSNLQCFFPIFHHFIEGSLGSQGLCTDALESMRALRRITMELRKITREEAADLEHLQQLQILHHSLTRAAFGYDHIRPKHHARFHLPKQLKQSGFHADCFPGEKKHKLYKSHIGLHRFDPWTKSKDGQFSHFVLLEMWKHHLEALRKFTFSNYLIGAKKPDPSTGTLLNSTICHVSPSLQYMGHTITAKDVLLGEFPGIVLGAIETENFFFVRLQMLEMEKAEEFHSWWTTTNKEKIVPAALAGRSPTWWLAETAQRLRCWH